MGDIKRKRKLKRRKRSKEAVEVENTPSVKKIIRKKYKREQCHFIKADGRRCRHRAIGKGTLCRKHGGISKNSEALVSVEEEKKEIVRVPTKYDPARHPIEYIALARAGMSDPEIAAQFGVGAETIRKWSEKYESFAIAYDVGKSMHEAWWIEKGKDNLNDRSFSTPLYKFMTANLLGYSDKMETKNTNMNVHGVLLVPDAVSEEEWEKDVIDVN